MNTPRDFIGLTLPPNAHLKASDELLFYGDLDDHLRVITTFALRLQAEYPVEANACLEDDLTWRLRLDAFAQLANRVRMAKHPVAVLVNTHLLTAHLHSRDEDRWDDVSFAGQRVALSKLLEVLRAESIVETLDTSRALSSTPIKLPIHIARKLLDRSTPPAVIKLAEGLHALGWRDEYLLNLIIEASGDDQTLLNGAIFHAAFSTLGPAPLRALKRLAALRAPLRLNGTLGPLTLDSDDAQIPRHDLELLTKLGWLHSRDAQAHHPSLWIEPLARDYVRTMTNRPETRQLGGFLRDVCAKLAATDDRIARMEAHHLAINTHDVDAAIETADHYGADLRAIGQHLSEQAKSLNAGPQKLQCYQRAADVYRQIVDRFDEEDAYAWEYFAYNREASQRFDVDEQTLQAYRRADELEGGANPLYRGRLVAALIRQEPHAKTTLPKQELERILSHEPEDEALHRAAWFIAPVLIAFEKMKAPHAKRDLIRLYGPKLVRSTKASRHLQRWNLQHELEQP